MGTRLMIIELGNYNSAKELLIGTRTTGSQVPVCYQNGDQSAFVSRAAVRMEVEGRGMRIGHRGAYKWAESIHVVMSLYLMSVYSITRSQLCFNWVLDYVNMRLLSPTQFIWRPSVPQFSSSGTHRINTRSNVTVPDVSVFHHKESIVFQLGA